MRPGKLWVCKADRSPDDRWWLVIDLDSAEIIARFASHRAALNYALWKSALLPNYGGAAGVDNWNRWEVLRLHW